MAADFLEDPRFAILDDRSPGESPSASDARTPVRGVGWVLRWAGAMVTLSSALLALVEFACLLSAEQTLTRAARAGALESTLPRATLQSVEATVGRRLFQAIDDPKKWQVFVEQDGTPATVLSPPADGGHLRVTVTASASAFLPSWLNQLRWWRDDVRLEGRGEQLLPGRRLR